MHKKISVGITASLVLIAITITFTGTMIFSMNKFNGMVTTSSAQREAMYDRIVEIDKIVQSRFYLEVDSEELYAGLINGYVAGMQDSDTVFLTYEQIAEMDRQARGTMVGLGLEFTKTEEDAGGHFLVTKVYPESPANKSNIGEGDRITQIEGESVASMSLEEGRSKLQGSEGETVKLEYVHYDKNDDGVIDTSSSTVKTASLEFAVIESTSVEGFTVGDVYYVRIRSLWDTAPAQFSKILAAANSSFDSGEAIGLILDLRDVDTGNNIEVVKEILDPILPVGTILQGIYRGGETKVICTSDASSVEIPIVALINQKTSGYAEAIAAVLKDSAICVGVVGSRTAGKGTLKQLNKLSDGSGINISVALLKPPKSDTYHGVGIDPITEVNVADDFVVVSSPNSKNDKQFAKAYEILKSYS